MSETLHANELPRLSDFVAQRMGLHFPESRWTELQRGIAATAKELGFASGAECARQLLQGPATQNQLDVLACHLTVGETYFWREKRSFELLTEQIIPALIDPRRRHDQRLRIWSAACCTGEEAYSIAIALRRVIPDIDDWNITLLATDINPRFLRKAKAGVFGRWSFRDIPAGFQESYFRPVSEGRWEILPQIKRMVRFAPLNLVEDFYPSLENETNAMDVIFCRNVLMYFTPPQVQKVLANLYRAQMDGGWLIVGAGELSQISNSSYAAANLKGTIHYRKSADVPRLPSPQFAEPLEARWVAKPESPIAEPPAIKRLVEIEKTEKVLPASSKDEGRLRQAARMFANQGRLAEALDCCQQWVERDRLNPSGHYLRAVILQEQGLIDEAIRSLRGALYLDPGFVLAHFALGNIARGRGRRRDAEKHLENARQLLSTYPLDQVLPESEGVTAGRFREIVDQLCEMEVVE